MATNTAVKANAKEKAANELIIKLPNVRLAFPQLWVPKSFDGKGKEEYSASFIISPDQTDVIAQVEKAILIAARNKWKDKADTVLKALKLADKTALHNGDLKTEYDGYAGNFYVSARNEIKPRVVDRQAMPLGPQDGIPYGGCYVIGSVAIWAQDNEFGKRVNAKLRGVQFVKDGDAFGAGKPAGDDEFDSVDDTDGEELA